MIMFYIKIIACLLIFTEGFLYIVGIATMHKEGKINDSGLIKGNLCTFLFYAFLIFACKP